MISAPYNFVPLNEHVYIPSWHAEASHDIPFRDGEDGWLEVTWRNESPLFVRDTSTSPKKEEQVYSMHVVQPDGRRLYFIPGSSMKGMLRSLIGILSMGKMAQYNNRFFGYREFDTKVSMGKNYQAQMQQAKVGWLEKSYNDNQDAIYLLHPCLEEREKIEISEVKERFGDYDEKKSSWERNEYIAKKYGGQFFPEIEPGYCLFCTGWMENKNDPERSKKHEILVPKDTDAPILLSEKVTKAFLTVYEPSPKMDKYLALLERGVKVPVSYVKADNGGIKAIGLGRMFRFPYQNDVQTLVENEQDPKQYGQGHDLVETMFGWAERNDSMKGRVQIGNAFAAEAIADAELGEVKGVLGQPRASFYPLYVKQTSNPYKTYEDATAIAGRKLYRVHGGSSTTALPKGNGNENTMTKFHPVPAGQEFTMRINLHNVLPIEVGALLWAITLNGTPGVWHNIGQAKSFGYGKLACKGVALHGLKCTEGEYMQAFEETMTRFCLENDHITWQDEPSVTALVNIFSEHTDADVRMMELKEYAPYRRNSNFDMLHEGGKRIVSTLSATTLFKLRNGDLFAEAERLRNEGKLKEAKEKYKDIALEMQLKGIDRAEVEGIINDIDEELARAEAKAQAEAQEAAQQAMEAKLAAGLSAILDEKFEQGPNASTYKVKEWKVCLDKVKKWLKDKAANALDDTEREALAATVKRLKDNPIKKEVKDWANPNSRLWREIAQYLREEETNKLKQ